MLSNIHKRIILIIIDVLFSWYIWEVNVSLGNPCYTTAFSRCFILSITTFLIFYTPFEIYFSFRELWFDRWPKLYHKDLEVSTIKINVSDGFLSANLVRNQNRAKINLKNALVIICHGFSDTKETLEYFYYPLAYHGYIVLAYDARGTGKSKKTGNRSDFLKRIEDFKKLIEWVKNQEEFSSNKIYCIGFSIGAITVLSGGFLNSNIEKIVAISSMSYYKQNIPKYNPVVRLSYLIKGVKLNPNEKENNQLSPYLLFQNAKKELSSEEWKDFSKKVMLIHCKNDRVIKFKNFKENRLVLESPEKNILILKKGGHSQKKNECVLVGATLNFLNS
ncbi:MAG: alpha/beta fold hydrolase [Candidatus Lokiarchaeota archaeon]|nr:alpha/beta fold hydrolase [Candidatus Lokiarchaeota archaeon]